MTIARVAAAIERVLPGRVERNVDAGTLTTYRVGGPLALLVRVATPGELLAVATAGPLPETMVIGRGSNLLVSDAGFPGVVVMLEGEFTEIDVADDYVRAGGAVPLPVLARRTASAGLAGLEFYVGIPGSVGGAVRMNAGGHGRETAAVLDRAWCIDLALGTEAVEREVEAAQFGFSYRHSNLAPFAVVTRAQFRCERDDVDACMERIEEIVRWRRDNQPGGANAGSVFRNPPGDSAGRLIESIGCKGLRIGGAVVSDKHANFIQAEAGARAQDVYDLVRHVRDLVREHTGIELETEIHFIGFE
jgi:UDP-N-acetylmuramate dehydrogenase